MSDIKYNTVSLDGVPPRYGETLAVDHIVQEFRITVRSLQSVHAESLKNLIEQKFEVVEAVETACTAYVRRP